MLTKEHEMTEVLTHGISRNNLGLVNMQKNIDIKLVM